MAPWSGGRSLVALLFTAVLPLASVTAAEPPKPWTLGARHGRQCFLSPEGQPLVLLAISHASLTLHGPGNAKLGPTGRTQRIERAAADLRDLGFNSIAVGFDTWGQAVPDEQAWSQLVKDFAGGMKDQFPFIAGMDRFVGDPKLPAFGSSDARSRFEDVFDPAFKARLREKVRLLCALMRDSRNCIGYWWSDIPPWQLAPAKQRFGRHWVDYIRELPENAPGRRRYAAFLQAVGPHDDHAFLRLIARELYTELAAAFRESDPKRLLFGERYNNFNVPDGVVEEAAKFVDVISVQPYESTFSEAKYDALHRLTGKPIIISDWTLSYPTPEHNVTMWPQFRTPAEAATAYEAYLRAAFGKPYFLGYFKCQYVDQPLPTGMLKQGLNLPDGSPREEFRALLRGIHQRLTEQWRVEGRLPP